MKPEPSDSIDDNRLIDLTRKHSEALTECMLEIFALYHVSRSLNISLQIDNIFDEAESQMKKLLGITEFSVMLLDSETGSLSVWKASRDQFDDIKDITFNQGEGICGIVAKTSQPIKVDDVAKDDRFLFFKGAHRKIGSFFSAPLKSRSGKVLGVFNVHKKEANAFKERDMLVYNAVAMHIAQAVENSCLFEETQKQAITEGLTKLYSKQYFMEILNQEISDAKRRSGSFSILMMDVDNFKSVNDTYGHPKGDEVLKKIAATLMKNTRKCDVLARYGGDEIIIFLRGADRNMAKHVAQKLLSNVRDNVCLNGKTGSGNGGVTLSAGVALYPDNGATVEDVIEAADKALYAAKNSGRDRVSVSSTKPD